MLPAKQSGFLPHKCVVISSLALKAKIAPDVINFDSKKFDRMSLGKNESFKDKILKSPIEKLQKETLLQTLFVIYTFE